MEYPETFSAKKESRKKDGFLLIRNVKNRFAYNVQIIYFCLTNKKNIQWQHLNEFY